MCVQTCVHTLICVYINRYVYIYIYVRICEYIYIYTHLYALALKRSWFTCSLYVYTGNQVRILFLECFAIILDSGCAAGAATSAWHAMRYLRLRWSWPGLPEAFVRAVLHQAAWALHFPQRRRVVNPIGRTPWALRRCAGYLGLFMYK